MDRAAVRSSPFKILFRKLEAAVMHIEQSGDVSAMLEEILQRLCRDFEGDLGFEGGRIYRRSEEDYELCCGFGSSQAAPTGLRVPSDYPPHRRLLEEGIVLMARGEPGVDDAFEDAIGVGSKFAAIGIGEGPSHIIAFSLRHGAEDTEVLHSLTLVRHVINLKLQQRLLSGTIDAARIMQEGILPRGVPELGDFEIAAASRPAETVSGDLFDYLPISACCVGIAIADSSGHGLPAAVLARDVITALRTASGLGLGVASIVERVNGVVRHATLSGTFVTLFYAQLSEGGALEYCNAGHDAPLLLTAGALRRLDVGGGVLGPFPGARYESGRTRLEPGNVLVLYTDGIVERRNTSGEFYGTERLTRLLPGLSRRRARDVVAAILADVEDFAEGRPAQDDMTVMVIRRREGEAADGGRT